MNFKNILCASLSALVMSSYAAAESQKPVNGDMAFLNMVDKYILIQYDTNKDGMTDTMYVYQIIGRTENGSVALRLDSIAKDKNNDGQFTIDEVVWMNGEPV